MDVASYLLGKKSGGGSTPTYQEKEVEITENTTTNITPDTGYDALSKVKITTNVSGGGSLTMGYVDLNVSPSNYGTKDLTFENLLGEPKLYTMTLSSSNNATFYLSIYDMTICQIWDGTSDKAINHGLTIKYNSSNMVNMQQFITTTIDKATYNSSNNSLVVHSVNIPYQNGYQWQTYRLYYYY